MFHLLARTPALSTDNKTDRSLAYAISLGKVYLSNVRLISCANFRSLVEGEFHVCSVT